MLNIAHQPCFCQYLVSGSLLLIVSLKVYKYILQSLLVGH